jgi:hypothetical protein
VFIVAVVGLAVKLGLDFFESEKEISWAEYGIGLAVMAFILAPAVASIGWKVARTNLVSFDEYWNGYRGIQDKLLDMLRGYDSWRQSGIIQSWIISSWLNVPSQRLEARIGTDTLRGNAARDKMYQIVLASKAKAAYEFGTMDPLNTSGK